MRVKQKTKIGQKHLARETYNKAINMSFMSGRNKTENDCLSDANIDFTLNGLYRLIENIYLYLIHSISKVRFPRQYTWLISNVLVISIYIFAEMISQSLRLSIILETYLSKKEF